MSNVLQVTDATVEAEVLRSDLPVLIDFWADWCQPCHAIAPHIDAVAQKYAGRLKVVKIDVEANPASVQAFRVQAMPTLVLMHQGQVVDVQTGAVDQKTLEAFVAKVAQPSDVESFDPERLAMALEIDMALPVDLRSAADYGRAHLPKAISLPPEEVDGGLAQLAAAPEVTYVFYSRGSEGVTEVAERAAALGVAAGVLDGGLLAWEAELKPIERG